MYVSKRKEKNELAVAQINDNYFRRSFFPSWGNLFKGYLSYDRMVLRIEC